MSPSSCWDPLVPPPSRETGSQLQACAAPKQPYKGPHLKGAWECTGHSSACTRSCTFFSFPLVFRSCLATTKAQGLLPIKRGRCNGYLGGTGTDSACRPPSSCAEGLLRVHGLGYTSRGCSGGSRRSAPPPSHANPGAAMGFTPPRPPLLAATWPPKPPLSPRCSPKAQQSCKVPPGKSRNTGGSFSHSPRQVPAVGLHSPTRLPPGWLSLSRWPRGPCLPPMLFSSSSSSRPFSPCCKKKH